MAIIGGRIAFSEATISWIARRAKGWPCKEYFGFHHSDRALGVGFLSLCRRMELVGFHILFRRNDFDGGLR